MKYSLDTYRLYQSDERFSYIIRVKVTMKESVDSEVLRHSVNTAITRYPYFAVRVAQGRDGGYKLIPNDKPVAVLPVADTGHADYGAPDLQTKSRKTDGHDPGLYERAVQSFSEK